MSIEHNFHCLDKLSKSNRNGIHITMTIDSSICLLMLFEFIFTASIHAEKKKSQWKQVNRIKKTPVELHSFKSSALIRNQVETIVFDSLESN